MLVLETALAIKFSNTIKEAIGKEPDCPAAYAHLESSPQYVEIMHADVALLKDYIVSTLARGQSA
jgi:threonine synthase